MPPSMLKQELQRIGNALNRWKAELVLALFASGVFAALAIFSFGDLYLQYGRTGRFLTFMVLVGLVAFAVRMMLKFLSEKHSVMGLAAVVEISFPELDNHLINFLQFSDAQDNDPFKRAYIQRGVPEWSKVKPSRMKDRRRHLRANLAFATTLMVFLAPFFFNGEAWGTAILRVVNPFSSIGPVSLTNIITVEPGDVTVLAGQPVMLKCSVTGQRGHKVHVDIDPSDNARSVYSLGLMAGSGKEEQFSFTVPKVTTDLRYRFRAGDSPSPEWYKVKVRAPLALSKAELNVVPPSYVGAKVERFDGLSDEVFIIQGSQVDVTIECNTALVSAEIRIQGGEPVVLSRAGKDTVWKGSIQVAGGDQFQVVAKDTYGDELESGIKYALVADAPPVVEIISPRGRMVLAPNTDPVIEFAVVDDYGLSSLVIEAVGEDGAGTVIKTWDVSGRKDLNEIWKHELKGAGTGKVLSYRVVVKDSCPYKDQTVKSAPVIFNAASIKDALQVSDRLKQKADANLGTLINLQRDNISQTSQYIKEAGRPVAARWQELADRQEEVKTVAKVLLSNPLKPLGNLTESVSKCYLNEMTEAVSLLKKVTESSGSDMASAETALQRQERILRTLTFASSGAQQVDAKQKVSMLSAMLTKLINDQKDVVTKADEYSKGSMKVPGALVDKQENLSMDLTEFIRACKEEAIKIESNEQGLAGSLRAAADACGDQKIREDMIISADKLDQNVPREALPSAQLALVKLEGVRNQLEQVLVAEEQERLELMQDAMSGVQEKITKAKQLHAAAKETMDAVAANRNKDTEQTDMMEEEYKELVKNTKDAMLQIPTDLHTFMELGVANEMAEEIVSVFEDLLAEKKSKEDIQAEQDGAFRELPTVKDLTYLDAMEEVEERLDDLEMWLETSTHELKVLQEAMDKNEMPDEVALGAMSTKLEDLVGELLEEEDHEDFDKNDDDSATNKSAGDWEAGGEAAEGEVEGYGAKGKSGNEKPDHKEVSGRSGVGRQGMSSGETAAGSGTISEGDDNIEARRTQDPTQSGQVDVAGEADTNADGGGKQGTGKADEFGMAGGEQRMDSTEAGSIAGLEAMMSQCESMQVKANMKNVKSASLGLAAHHVKQLKDAIADRRPIEQINEYKKNAVAALKRAQAELSSTSDMALDSGAAGSVLGNLIDTGGDSAPTQYKDLVSEYYKSLSEGI